MLRRLTLPTFNFCQETLDRRQLHLHPKLEDLITLIPLFDKKYLLKTLFVSIRSFVIVRLGKAPNIILFLLWSLMNNDLQVKPRTTINILAHLKLPKYNCNRFDNPKLMS